MIIINKFGYLKYKKLQFRCALGKSGIGIKKVEGDNITPKGTFKVLKIYYRKDRVKKISTKLKLIQISKNIGWCDDPKSKKYNQPIRLPTKYSHEKLFRRDNLYDLVLVLNYNTKPIKKNKGSAIFIHITKNYKTTAGCIGLRIKNMITLIKILNEKNKIKIIN